MSKSKKTVTVSAEEYQQLVFDSNLLTALIEAGVEDWDGFGKAQDILEGMYEEEDAACGDCSDCKGCDKEPEDLN